MARAAVQEKSGAPWPSPVSGEKYSAQPCSSTRASGAAAQVVGEVVLAVRVRGRATIIQLVFTQVGPFQ